jgi:hypothetical protein
LVGGEAIAALGVHDVAYLETETAQGGNLFGAENTADLYFRVNSHAQLRGLGSSEVVDSLFDQIFVGWIGVERLVESDVCFAHALVRGLSFVPVLGNNPADRLSLIGCQMKLLDRVGLTRIDSGVLLSKCDRDGRKQNQ